MTVAFYITELITAVKTSIFVQLGFSSDSRAGWQTVQQLFSLME